MGRECPAADCEGYFKVKPGIGLSGPDLQCHCPYCGHSDIPDSFWTKEQVEYAKSIALREVADAISADLKSLEFDIKPKGHFGIGVSAKLQRGQPVPIRHYREQTLETNVTCHHCSLEYAVFGVFGFCPHCKEHNSLTILDGNFELIAKQLELATTLSDSNLERHLIEDALENCVSAFDAFAREAVRIRSSVSANPSQSHAISFQNLPLAVSRLQSLFGVDLKAVTNRNDWNIAHCSFMKRHLLAHRAGVIDQKYLDETGEPQELLGRRVSVKASDVKMLVPVLSGIATTLITLLPPP